MHVLEYLHRNVKTVAMPSAMVAGALLCRPVTALEAWTHQMITPSLIFLMLFVTFCRVKPSQMKPSMLHVWLLLFQVVVSAALYFALLPLDAIVAQGAMICVLAPVAMAAVVIAGMLGANVPTMATYSLLCNMAIALIAPVVLSLAGTGACSFTQILARIAPLLIMPFAAAQFCRFLLPKTAKWIGDHSQISFYMWLASLVVIIGRTTAFIIDLHDASLSVELWLAFAALAICLVQFKVGRMLGRRYGDAPAGGQSLGQKNTVLAVWMAQSFLDPISNEVDPGAETITYYSYDKVGLAKIISNYATDLPRADVKGKPTTAIIKSIGDSYGYSIQEMRASRMAGKSLDTRKAESARYQIDYLNNKIAWNGDAETGLRGVLSTDNDIPLYVIANGAKGTTKWADKDADEILADITGMMTQMARTTKKVEKPDTLALPAEAYIILQNRRIDGTASNLLTYIQDNIKDIQNIVSCPELDPDSVDTNPYAADEDGKGVMLLFKNDARKLTIENPLPFIQYPVQTQGLEMVVPCEARTAGAIIYYPMSLLIATGIC